MNVIKEKIVIIEDDKGIIDVLTTLCLLNKINVFFAETGNEGIKLIKSLNPDLIICDIKLSDMLGYEVLKEVRSSQKHFKIPFVFLSAFADPDDIRKGMDLGADDYLTKPFTNATLLQTIHSRILIKKKQLRLESIQQEEQWLSVFSSNFNHEFLTPLNGIINSINLIAKSGKSLDPHVFEELLNSVFTSGYRMKRNTQKLIIHTYLGLGKVANPGLQYISNLSDLLLDSLAQLKRQYANQIMPIEITLAEKSSSSYKLGNYEYIKFLFEELLENAYKFNRNDSLITSSLSAINEDGFLFEINNQCDENLVVNTNDISPFKKFHDAMDKNGLGIGLNNCLAICQLLNYDMDVKCKDGQFKVSIKIKLMLLIK
jgi:CheY-like chemotaxis protein